MKCNEKASKIIGCGGFPIRQDWLIAGTKDLMIEIHGELIEVLWQDTRSLGLGKHMVFVVVTTLGYL